MTRKPLHPSLFRFNKKFIDPKLRKYGPNLSKILKEEAEQVYSFRLFTPQYCKLLLEEAEHRNKWITGLDEGYESISADAETKARAANNLMVSQKDGKEPDTKQYFGSISYDGFGHDWTDARHSNGGTLSKIYVQQMATYVLPMIHQLWGSFSLGTMDPPYILKYEPNNIKQMSLHYDFETVALLVYLNTEFTGGGTYFPRWKFKTGRPKPGLALFYPGGLSHEHLGIPLTSGRRYLMCGSFFDKKVEA